MSSDQTYIQEKRARLAIYYADKKKRRHAFVAETKRINDARQEKIDVMEKPHLDKFLADEEALKPSAEVLANESDVNRYHRLIEAKLRRFKYDVDAHNRASACNYNGDYLAYGSYSEYLKHRHYRYKYVEKQCLRAHKKVEEDIRNALFLKF